MLRVLKKLLPFFLGTILSIQVIAQKDKDLETVDSLIQTSVNQTLTIIKDKKLTNDEKKQKVIKLIGPLFNFDLIAKLSLGRTNWNKFSKEQQKEFQQLFTVQLQDSYFDKIILLTDETVEFLTPVKKSGNIYAPTLVKSKDKRYQIIYKLYKKGGPWLVYDVEIEGVSLLKSYGMQYDQFLAENPPKTLLDKLRSKALDEPEDLKSDKKHVQ